MKRTTKPDALIVTMSKQNVNEWGGVDVLDRFFQKQYGKENDATFWYKIGNNLPLHEVLFVYVVIHNKIRWRFNCVGYEDTESVILHKAGKPVEYSGKFVIITGVAIKAPEDIPYKGFQGFRYSNIIY